MVDDAYRKLAKVLDTLPAGFPSTRSGVEIKILKKIFTPEEADLFCDLRLTPESAAQVAQRTLRPLDGLEERLLSMRGNGELSGFKSDGVWMFKMIPWVVGIYEFQVKRMDREFTELCREYSVYWGHQFSKHGPRMMQVIPVEKEIPVKQEALTYQQVSNLIEKAASYAVNECICRKGEALLGNPCSKPLEVCLAMAPEPGMFDENPFGAKVIGKQEAYDVLRKAEEAGLVHLTSNMESGHWFICNCCGCCCGVLRAVNMGAREAINSYYYAEIDPERCSACGICADERCQVQAIKKEDGFFSVVKDRCIGCGLCASSCPGEAVRIIPKRPEDLVYPPADEKAWFEEKGRQRGVDFSAYK